MAIFKKLIESATVRKPASEQSNVFIDNLFNIRDSLDASELCWSPYNKLRREMLRLMIFSHGNRLVYDSKTVISVADAIISDCPKSKCGGFQYLPHASDSKQIEKMVFGTSSKPDIFKVHTLTDTDALVLSRIFSVSKSTNTVPSANKKFRRCHCVLNGSGPTSSDSDSKLNYSVRSLDTLHDTRSSSHTQCILSKTSSYSSTEPPDKFTRLRNASLQSDVDDDPLRAFSLNCISRIRRRQLSLKGLCDDGTIVQNSVPLHRSRMSSCSSATDSSSLRIPVNSYSQSPRVEKFLRNYGIAILFPSDDKDFVFQHILQIEADILKLILKINLATAQKTNYLKLVYEAWLQFCSSICLLHNAQRLRRPVWLSLTNPLLQNQTATEFSQKLAKLVDLINTKETKFFLSTLISSVLMSHLSWVASIMPPDNCSYDRSLLLGTAAIDSRHNPYNAKAAQYIELMGGIGLDNPTARTIVLGTDQQLLTEILFVLSYFIRCSSVENKRREDMTPDLVSPLKNFVDDSTVEVDTERIHTIAVLSSSTENDTSALSSSICSDENMFGRSHCYTPPPTKVRAISQNMSPSIRQYYELIVDTKQVNSPRDSGDIPTSLINAASPESSSRTYLNLKELDRPTDFGRTLLAGVCCNYSPHFVSSGIDKRYANIDDIHSSIHHELCNPPEDISSIVNFTTNPLSSVASLQTNRQSSERTELLLQRTSFIHKSLNKPINNNLESHLTTDIICAINDVTRVSASSSLYSDVKEAQRVGSINCEEFNVDAHSQCSIGSRTEIKPTAIVILADLSTYTIKTVSGGIGSVNEHIISSPSETIASMLEEFLELFKQKCAPTFLISFIEDRLRSILLKSNVLVGIINDADALGNISLSLPTCYNKELDKDNSNIDEVVNINLAIEGFDDDNVIEALHQSQCDSKNDKTILDTTNNVITMDQMSRILDCHCSDLRLILNVASVCSPGVLSSAL